MPALSKRINQLHQAFIELLNEKNYDQISISDITQKAEINRRTFYLHYENKQQLFEEIVGNFIEWYIRPFVIDKNEKKSFADKIDYFTSQMLNNIELAECLLSSNNPNCGAKVIASILSDQSRNKNVQGHFLFKFNDPDTQQYYLEIISHHCISTMRYIIKNKNLPKDEIINNIKEVCHIVSSYYEPRNYIK